MTTGPPPVHAARHEPVGGGLSRLLDALDGTAELDTRDLVELGPGRCVALVSGRADVFAVAVDLDGPSPWAHLVRVVEGTLLTGSAPVDGTRLVARAIPGSRLVDLGPAGLAPLVVADAPAVAVGVECFVGPLRRRLGPTVASAPPDLVPLVAGATALGGAGGARPVDGLLWLTAASVDVVVHHGGEPRAHGPGSAAVLPLTDGDWVEGPTGATITAATTVDVVRRPDRDQVLTATSADIIAAAAASVARLEQADADRVARRHQGDDELGRQADLRFARVLAGTDERRALLTSADPSFAAAAIVGGALGMTVVPARPADLRRGTDGLAAVARASRFRTRVVRLESGWYHSDAGPLVGFLKTDMHPVALVRRGRGYVIEDARTGATTPVDATSARSLHFEARMLYPPLPERVISGVGLLRFGLGGSGVDVGLLLVTSVVVALLSLVTPIVTGRILGDLVPRAERSVIFDLSVLLLVIAVLVAVVSLVQNLVALRIEGRVDVRSQAGVWDRLMALPAPFFRRYTIGTLSSAALGINGIRDALSGVAVQAVLATVTGVANLGLMLWYDLALGLVGAAVVAAGAVVSIVLGRQQVRLQRVVLVENNEVASATFQLMTGIAKLRVAAAEDRAYAFWSVKFAAMRTKAFAARTAQNRLTVFNAGYAILAPGLIYAYIGVARDGQFPLSTFLSLNVAFILVLASMLQLTGTGITVLAVVPLFEQLRPILQTVPEVDADKVDPGELSGDIEVSHVTFGYDEDGPPVLEDVSFRAGPGEFVALVGPSGCGKSTLLRLLLGFEDPRSGAIRYDGRSLGDLDASAVRRQCGVVLQNGQLFAGDLLSNIVGTSTFTVEEAWQAVDRAGMRADIEQMPMGMNTLVSEGAGTMSGGQRQRLMIARALIARPRMVFFDEATSALDNRTQAIVTESMHKLDATRIVIAHRLSTIMHADRIVVMDRGRVVQAGSFDELMASDGMFRQLASRQIA